MRSVWSEGRGTRMSCRGGVLETSDSRKTYRFVQGWKGYRLRKSREF